MKNRYLFILIIFVLSIGAVCAQEDTASDDSIGIVQEDIAVSASEIVIDDSNYDTYFNSTNGMILETSNISDGDTIKLGNVSNKYFKIDKLLTITSNSSSDILTNVSFIFVDGSANSTISNLNIVNDYGEQTPFSVYEVQNIEISDNKISVVDLGSYDIYAIYAWYANNLIVEGNVITYVGKTDGVKTNAVISVSESSNVIVIENDIEASLVSCHIDWIQSPPSYNYVPVCKSQGLYFDECSDLTVYGNHICVESNGISGTDDSIYGINIYYCDGVTFEENIINCTGLNYIYALVIRAHNFNVNSNEFNVVSDEYEGYYADVIDIESDSTGIVENNVISVSAPSIAYGIYTAMAYTLTDDNPTVDYVNNYIDGIAYSVYGMEVFGTEGLIKGNHLILEGNYTLGIASMMMDDITIFADNVIEVYGLKNGTYPSGDYYVPAQTLGILTMSESQIYNNIITTPGVYTIINSNWVGSIITSNYLIAGELFGDESVDDTSDESVIENNIPIAGATNYNVTQETFYLFFDEDGYLRDGITADSLTFIGEFKDLNFWNTIDRPIDLLSDNATLYNMTFVINSDNVTMDGFTFICEEMPEIITVFESDNIVLSNNTFMVIGAKDEGNALIHIVDSDNVELYNNTIYFEVETNETITSTSVLAQGSNGLIMVSNKIISSLPARSTDWTTGTVYSHGVFLDDCDDAYLFNNTIGVKSNNQISVYGTIYAVQIIGDNAIVIENRIGVAEAPYGYSLVIAGENFNITGNLIGTGENQSYTCGIDVESNSYGTIDNNIIYVVGDSAYGIYTANWAGDVKINITNNSIETDGITSFAMSLSGSEAFVENNTINSKGNFTTGIASTVDVITINNNTIIDNASDKGIPAGYDTMGIETTGIHIVSGNATVTNNDIKTNGKFAVDAKGTGSVTDNSLFAKEYTGDAAVDGDPANTIVADNIPPMIRVVINAEDCVMYYKNGTRYIFILSDQFGNPMANVNVTLIINGVSYTRTTDSNGTASLAINLNSGNYTLSASFIGIGLYTNASVENNITVMPTVYGDDIVKVFRNGTQYYATFLDGQGNPLANGTEVTFNINGVMYKRYVNGTEGKAKLSINLPQGEYIVTAINPVTGEMHANNITVLASITDNNDLVKYYKNASQYVVTIIGDDGNPVGVGVSVTFNINGVFYTRQTNESGQAKLNINLAPGDYIITADYKGCKVSNNIKVLPVLSAEDLVKKYGTPDQFVATLVDGQGNPYEGQNVTFNINGVFYNKVTDDSGNAKLNINLRAGEYIITSSYNGGNIANTIVITA